MGPSSVINTDPARSSFSPCTPIKKGAMRGSRLHPWSPYSLGPKGSSQLLTYSFINTHKDTHTQNYRQALYTNTNLIVNIHMQNRGIFCILCTHTHSHITTEESMTFLCAHWSFMWFYDDILIKAISHRVGTVIKNIPTPSGVVTSLLQYTKKERKMRRSRRRMDELLQSARSLQWVKL